MRIGQVIQGNYQVVAKLDYGTTSTVWLSRDLRDDKFWVLKVHISTLKHNQELLVSKHLSDVNFDHAGKKHVRQFQQTFKLNGPPGEHDVFVMRPLGISLRTLQELQKDKVFQKDLVIGALDQTLLGLDYLHDSNVIHTDIHSDNLLIALTNDSILPKWRIMSFTGRQHESALTTPSSTSLSTCWGALVTLQFAISDRRASGRCTAEMQCQCRIALLKSFSI
ncbi:unnamed protein product [Fusarium graminearum]|nr:unnamed protein product [Fusarium graminearum]